MAEQVNNPDAGRSDVADHPGLADAIVATIQQPLLVLDKGLAVLKANHPFYRLFQVSADEVIGRRLFDLGNGQWNIPELRTLLENVVAQAGYVDDYRIEHAFPSIGRRVMRLSARRIESAEPRPPLILLGIADVTELERVRFELEGQKEYAEKLIDSIREALIVLGWDLRVKHANQPFYDAFKVEPGQTEGRLIYELGNGQWNIPALRRLLEDVLPKQQSFDDFEVTHEFESIGRRTMLLNARRLDHLNLILLAIDDVTEREEAHRRQRMLASELSHRVKNVLTVVDSLASRTSAAARSLDDFREVFHGRLRALARAHGQYGRSMATRRSAPAGDGVF